MQTLVTDFHKETMRRAKIEAWAAVGKYGMALLTAAGISFAIFKTLRP
jgi:hypothetical protein